MPKTLILVDALSCLYRSFYAVRGLTSPDGQPTNALFGFVKLINQLRSAHRPEYMAVLFDGGLPEKRTKALEGYKAQRPPMPEELRSQIPLVHDYLTAEGLLWVRMEKQEADDLIAVMTSRFKNAVDKVLIISTDKDLFQLVDGTVNIISQAGGGKVFDSATVQEKTGVAPSLIAEWLALIGDSSDNIPGVPGVGPKTASALLQQYLSIDGIYSDLESIKSAKVRESLRSSKDIVFRNLDIVRLMNDIDISASIEDLKPSHRNIEKLRDMYTALGFKSLRDGLVSDELPGLELI